MTQHPWRPKAVGPTPAPLDRRLFAALVDGALSFGVLVLLQVVLIGGLSADGGAAGTVVVLLLLLAWIGLLLYLLAVQGISPGKKLNGLMVVRVDTGSPPGWGAAIVRMLVPGAITTVTLGFGGFLIPLSILLDKDGRRGWHDKAAGVIVVDARAMPPGTSSMAHRATPGKSSTVEPVARRDAVPSEPVRLPSASGVDRTTGPTPAVPDPVVPSGAAAVPDLVVPSGAPVVSDPVVPAATPAVSDPVVPSAAPVGPSAGPVVAPVKQVSLPAQSTPAQAGHESVASSTPPAAGSVISFVPGFGGESPPPVPPAVGHLTAEVEDLDLTTVARPRGSGTTVVFDYGERVAVTGRGVVGRDPAPGDEPVDHLIKVPGGSLSVSKTHLEFGEEQGAFWVRDLHSTNGVRLEASGTSRVLTPGERTGVATGGTVRFGNHSFTVMP